MIFIAACILFLAGMLAMAAVIELIDGKPWKTYALVAVGEAAVAVVLLAQ